MQSPTAKKKERTEATTKSSASRSKIWKTYEAKAGGEESEQDFIERHLPLVKTVVDRIKMHLPSHLDPDDLYSVGITGLMLAARKFDPAQGNTFASYATMRIRGAVLDELRRLDWMPRSSRLKAKKLKELVGDLEQRLGRAASEEEICAELNISAEEYEKLMDEVKPICFIPLDAAASPNDTEQISLHEVIPDENQPLAPARLEKKELMELVSARIQELPDVQKKILAMYYFENMRLAEIAAVFGLTESRISQIHAQVVLSLRAYMQGALSR